jgi:hypothetical protein
VKIARRSDIDIGPLPSRHFPQISIPEELANHIRDAASQHA